MPHVRSTSSVFGAEVILIRGKRAGPISVIKRSAVSVLREDRKIWTEMALNLGEKLMFVQNAGGFIGERVYISDGSRSFRVSGLRSGKRCGCISEEEGFEPPRPFRA